jgi:hypothetical protein
MPKDGYWFCLTHNAVEGSQGCPNKDRLGPYRTSDEAERALARVAERNDEWENEIGRAHV